MEQLLYFISGALFGIGAILLKVEMDKDKEGEINYILCELTFVLHLLAHATEACRRAQRYKKYNEELKKKSKTELIFNRLEDE